MLFSDIIGQEKIKKQLITNTLNSRVAHAQLFAEPGGSGALGMAIAYARYLNCLNRTNNDSCGTCNSCVKFNKIAHPDLHLFFPTAPSKDNKNSNSKSYLFKFRELLNETHYLSLSKWYEHIGIEKKHAIINVDDCSEMLHLSSIKTYESKYKVFIVWMAEKFFHKAIPKLLKVIEEPPGNTVFLFITHEKNKIPETIISRMQLITFPALTNSEIKNALIERYNCDTDTADNISFQSSGNFTQALDQLSLSQPSELFYIFRNWLRACYSPSPPEIFAYTDKIASFGREKQKALLNFGLNTFNNCLLINYNANKPLRMYKDEIDFLLKFSKFVNHKNIIPVTNCFNEAISHIERNANGKLVFADLSFKMNKLFRVGAN